MNETLKFKLLTFIRYLGDSFFYPFFALFLKHNGLIESEIGFILSISPLLGIIMNPIYSSLCKNHKITKNVLMVITVIEAICIFVITNSTNLTGIAILTILIAIFGSCHYGLFDSLIAVYSTKNNINYSSIRIFGSMAYIIGTTVGGIVIKNTSFMVCFSICAILFILSGVFYGLIKNIDGEKEKQDNINYKEVLKNKSLWLFIVLYVFIMGPLVCGDHFFSVYLDTRGIDSTGYGYIYSFYVIVEVVLLYIFNKKSSKLNNNILLLIASIMVVFRSIVFASYMPIFGVVIASSFRGVSYAILLHVSFKRIVDIVGEKNSTLGVMIMTLCQAVFVFSFNIIDGLIIDATSTYAYFYLLMAGFGLISLVLISIKLIMNKKYAK